MYLLGTIALYVSVFSVLTLLFDYVNAVIPDPLNHYYSAADSIRWPLAVFVIIFPVFVWVSRVLYHDTISDIGKSDLRIRKWLMYLTLFLAALLILGDLITLLYNFLNGDLTIQFLLKILSVLVVSVGVFWYYLYDLRRTTPAFSAQARVFVWSALTVATVVVIAGFVIAGSPFRQRLIRFDEQRVSDLQTLQGQVVSYWQNKNHLPTSLDDLRDPISGFVPPFDPEIKAGYEYRTMGAPSFELCATFNIASDQSGAAGRMMPPASMYPTNDNWSHGTGRVCFDRTIDPDIYGRKVMGTPLPVPLPMAK